MDTNANDETIKDILKEDHTEIKNGGKKKSCVVRALIFFILLALLFFGFIYVQQYLLDLEAEAIVRAAQTATVLEKESSVINKSVSDDAQFGTGTSIEQQEATETPTPDPAMERTATIAAQLTSVADFQVTAVSTP